MLAILQLPSEWQSTRIESLGMTETVLECAVEHINSGDPALAVLMSGMPSLATAALRVQFYDRVMDLATTITQALSAVIEESGIDYGEGFPLMELLHYRQNVLLLYVDLGEH